MGIVVVQSFGICVVVHGVFVAKTFVFYLLFFAVEVLIVSCLHRQNSVQCKFRMWTVLPTAFFLCSNNRQMFCNCKPSVGFVGFALSFSAKNSCILFCNFVLVPFVDLKVCVCCFLRCVLQSSSALNFKT